MFNHTSSLDSGCHVGFEIRRLRLRLPDLPFSYLMLLVQKTTLTSNFSTISSIDLSPSHLFRPRRGLPIARDAEFNVTGDIH